MVLRDRRLDDHWQTALAGDRTLSSPFLALKIEKMIDIGKSDLVCLVALDLMH